jgi:hypothetical protein
MRVDWLAKCFVLTVLFYAGPTVEKRLPDGLSWQWRWAVERINRQIPA